MSRHTLCFAPLVLTLAAFLFVSACQTRDTSVGDPFSVHSEPVAPIDAAERMQRQMSQARRSQSGF